MEKCYGNSSETSSVCAWHFQWLNLTLPYPEEVLVSPEYGGLGGGMDLGVHVGLPHPGGEGLRVGDGQGGGVVMLGSVGLWLLCVV